MKSTRESCDGASTATPAYVNGMPPILRAFRHRNYQPFFGGQLISLTGTWMQQIAQSWLAYRLTHSSALLGLVSLFGQILLAPVGGPAADRVKRHCIIMWAHARGDAAPVRAVRADAHRRRPRGYLFVLAARQAFMVDCRPCAATRT